MRYDKRYARVPDMLGAPEVPRRADGYIKLCHVCQRQVYFAGGFMELLAKSLEAAARYGKWRRAQGWG